jgi:hypothetical protein
MNGKLVFKVESQGRPYAVMVLEAGLVTARINRAVLRGAFLAHALQWVKDRNPRPAVEPTVSVVGF